MSIRRTIVEVDTDDLNVREFCREHGVSTWFFYELRRRYQAEGDAALEPRSRAPRRVANRTAPDIENRIVDIRKELRDDGLDYGSASIRDRLLVDLDDPKGSRTPSEATIYRVLSRRGFVELEPKKAPKHAHRFFCAERANECWQIDDTTWELADGTEVKIINVLDDCSRVLVASVAVESCTSVAALDAVLGAAGDWGLPERVLSDNAKAFREGLATALATLGIDIGHSRPYHPQTCGKVERFHQTLKRFLRKKRRAKTLAELQAQIDWFRAHYNQARRHRGIGRRIPAQVWAESPKAGPAPRALTATRTFHGIVGINGTLSAGRGCRISLGAAFARKRAVVLLTGLACHVFVEGRLARQLTIDPSRRDQTLYDHPGGQTKAERAAAVRR